MLASLKGKRGNAFVKKERMKNIRRNFSFLGRVVFEESEMIFLKFWKNVKEKYNRFQNL